MSAHFVQMGCEGEKEPLIYAIIFSDQLDRVEKLREMFLLWTNWPFVSRIKKGDGSFDSVVNYSISRHIANGKGVNLYRSFSGLPFLILWVVVKPNFGKVKWEFGRLFWTNISVDEMSILENRIRILHFFKNNVLNFRFYSCFSLFYLFFQSLSFGFPFFIFLLSFYPSSHSRNFSRRFHFIIIDLSVFFCFFQLFS